MVFKRGQYNTDRKHFLWLLVLSNLLVFQLGGLYHSNHFFGNFYKNDDYGDATTKQIAFAQNEEGLDASANPLDIPKGRAVALPSIRIDDSETKYNRKIYGGKGDKPHLGGFSTNSVDFDGVSPALWKWIIQDIGVQSLLDIGCGRGVSTSWFHTHGVQAHCVEGSHDAIQQSLLPTNIVTEHDFSRGPWWPEDTVDAVWTVEVLEHIGRNFHKHLIPSLRKAAVIFATHSMWGGWHHVEVHESEWWIRKFESYGFKYMEKLTLDGKAIAQKNRKEILPNGKEARAQHLWLHLMVFVNPVVASLPKHHHLFAEPGCFDGKVKDEGGQNKLRLRHCGTNGFTGPDAETIAVESPIPESFKPIVLHDSMDEQWERLVFNKTTTERKEEEARNSGLVANDHHT